MKTCIQRARIILFACVIIACTGAPSNFISTSIRRGGRGGGGGGRSGKTTKSGGQSKGNNTSACFPSTATVRTLQGFITIGELQVGDVVRVRAGWSPVFAFSHLDPQAKGQFVEIHAPPRSIKLTKNHLLPTNKGEIAARQVRVGDFVVDANGAMLRVLTIRRVEDIGYYHPHTKAGSLVVDGVICSTYTESVPAPSASALLAPLRAYFSVSKQDATFGLLEKSNGLRNALLIIGRISGLVSTM